MQMGGRAPELSLEQREKRRLAKRIIKSIQPALEEAIRNESELNRQPFEKELNDLDVLLEKSVQSHRPSPDLDDVEDFVTPDEPNGVEHKIEELETKEGPKEELPAGSTEETSDVEMVDVDTDKPSEQPQDVATSEAAAAGPEPGAESQYADALSTMDNIEGQAETNGDYEKKESRTPQPPHQPSGPLTPPLSSQEDQQLPLAQGGIQWYMQPFDPVGTTIHEERWTGRDVMRGLSEELSELDEDELKDLVDDEIEQEEAGAANGTKTDGPAVEQPVKVHRTRTRRWRGFK